MGMRIGQGLLDVVNQAQRLLERLEVPPEEVGPVLQERRYRDTFCNGSNAVDNWLTSNDFKAKYTATVEGESYRASEVQLVQKKYEPFFNTDSFTPAPRDLVTFKAADLQRLCIRS